MKSIRTRIIGVMTLVVLGILATLGSVFAYTAPAHGATMSDEIVNGNFTYPTIDSLWWQLYGGTKRFLTINPMRGVGGQGCNNEDMFTFPSWDASKFGWTSTQPQRGTCSANNVELNYSPSDKNTYAELVADVADTSIYQDVATQPGAVYQWSLKHASASNAHLDSMQVMIGAPDKETAQDATRTTTNNLGGDPLGPVGKTIATPAKSSDYSVKSWETYTGTYVIPEGQTVTRFSFDSISSPDNTSGNNLDDIKFTTSYPLHYDVNGGTGTVPHTGYNESTKQYDNYYAAGTDVTLGQNWSASSISRGGATFLGWSKTKQPLLTDEKSIPNVDFVSKLTMPKADATVYAVWIGYQTLSYDVNAPANATKPTTPDSETVPYATPALDHSNWNTGDSTKIKGYVFDGWFTDKTGTTKYDFNTPLKQSTTVYAHWTQQQGTLNYNANGGTDNMASQSGPAYSNVAVKTNTFTRPGFSFAGFNTQADGKGKTYKANDPFTLPVGSATLYAMWKPSLSTLPATGGNGVYDSHVVPPVLALLLIALTAYLIHRFRQRSKG